MAQFSHQSRDFCLTLILVCWAWFMPAQLMAGDPTLDRLITNMTQDDVHVRDRARQQLIALCRGGHAELLQPYLTSSEQRQRLAALEIAGLIDQTDSLLEALQAALSDSDESIRFQAVRSLGRIGGAAASAGLRSALGRATGDLKATLCDAIGEAGEVAGAAALTAVLGDESLAVRYAAAHALWRLKASGQESAAEAAVAGEEDPQIRAWLLAYLVLRGSAAGEPLTQLATERDGLLRDLVIKAYVESGSTGAIPAWLEAMGHESWRVRFDAARGLAALARPEDVPALIDRLTDKRAEVRAKIAEALQRICGTQLGFQGTDSEPQREAAIARWKTWWSDNAYRFNLTAE